MRTTETKSETVTETTDDGNELKTTTTKSKISTTKSSKVPTPKTTPRSTQPVKVKFQMHWKCSSYLC